MISDKPSVAPEAEPMSCPSQQSHRNLASRHACTSAALLIGLAVLLWNTHVCAQPAPKNTNTDYERESENPVTHFYTLPLQYKASFEDGFYNATTNTFQLNNAVVPIPLDDDWFLITRSKSSLVSQAPKERGNNWENGLNNAQTTLFLSPARGNGFFWGVGPVISLPTATNNATGKNKWGSGPSVAFAWQGSVPWTVGFVINNVWSFGGPPHGSDRTNSLLLNPIVSYRFGDGWSLSTSPNITANWVLNSDKRWTVPIGAGIGKAFKIGAQPMTLKFETYHNVVRPGDHDSVWAAQLTLSFLFGR
jgi:Putative MetA-pathway of phenol degradation